MVVEESRLSSRSHFQNALDDVRGVIHSASNTHHLVEPLACHAWPAPPQPTLFPQFVSYPPHASFCQLRCHAEEHLAWCPSPSLFLVDDNAKNHPSYTALAPHATPTPNIIISCPPHPDI